MELLEPAVKRVAVGDPGRPDTEMGPLISAEHLARVASYVPPDAPVAFRGQAPAGPGLLVRAHGAGAGAPGLPRRTPRRFSGRWLR